MKDPEPENETRVSEKKSETKKEKTIKNKAIKPRDHDHQKRMQEAYQREQDEPMGDLEKARSKKILEEV